MGWVTGRSHPTAPLQPMAWRRGKEEAHLQMDLHPGFADGVARSRRGPASFPSWGGGAGAAGGQGSGGARQPARTWWRVHVGVGVRAHPALPREGILSWKSFAGPRWHRVAQQAGTRIFRARGNESKRQFGASSGLKAAARRSVISGRYYPPLMGLRLPGR